MSDAFDAVQRRLWLLQRLLEKMNADEALEMAARMEAFVTNDVESPPHQNGHAAANIAPPQSFAAQAGTTAPLARLKRDGTGRLLDEAELKAFTNRAAQGATNRELARLFGLTPRQANGIRMALAKQTPQVALRAAPVPIEPMAETSGATAASQAG